MLKWGWKTITGGIAIALGLVSAPGVLDLLPTKTASIVEAIGVLLAAIGIRHAVAKNTK
jgi:hypothetical protein